MHRLIGFGLVLLATLGTAAVSRAEVLSPCPNGDDLSYYVLWGRNLNPFTTQNWYQAPDRYVREIQPAQGEAIIYAICKGDVAAFEFQRNIATGDPLGDLDGELFDVVDATTGRRVGTRWWDFEKPYDQSGGLTLVHFRTCSHAAAGPIFGMFNNIGFWSHGMGTRAINGVKPETVQQAWTDRVQSLVYEVADYYMIHTSGLTCSASMDREAFMTTWANQNVYRDYLQIDPGDGIGGGPY